MRSLKVMQRLQQQADRPGRLSRYRGESFMIDQKVQGVTRHQEEPVAQGDSTMLKKVSTPRTALDTRLVVITTQLVVAQLYKVSGALMRGIQLISVTSAWAVTHRTSVRIRRCLNRPL